MPESLLDLPVKRQIGRQAFGNPILGDVSFAGREVQHAGSQIVLRLVWIARLPLHGRGVNKRSMLDFMLSGRERDLSSQAEHTVKALVGKYFQQVRAALLTPARVGTQYFGIAKWFNKPAHMRL